MSVVIKLNYKLKLRNNTHQNSVLHEVSADSDPGIGLENRYNGTDGIDGDSGQGFHYLD